MRGCACSSRSRTCRPRRRGRSGAPGEPREPVAQEPPTARRTPSPGARLVVAIAPEFTIGFVIPAPASIAASELNGCPVASAPSSSTARSAPIRSQTRASTNGLETLMIVNAWSARRPRTPAAVPTRLIPSRSGGIRASDGVHVGHGALAGSAEALVRVVDPLLDLLRRAAGCRWRRRARHSRVIASPRSGRTSPPRRGRPSRTRPAAPARSGRGCSRSRPRRRRGARRRPAQRPAAR